MKKLCSILALVMVLIIGGCSSNTKHVKTTEKIFTLDIRVHDSVHNKDLLNEKITVEGNIKTLADFLEKADELDVEMKDGQYGKTIMGIMGVKTENFNAGPWWIYESSNNASCKEKGQCDATSSLKIQDGDQFTFNYTSTF